MSKDSDHCEACGAPDDGTQTYCERCGEPLVDPKYIRNVIASTTRRNVMPTKTASAVQTMERAHALIKEAEELLHGITAEDLEAAGWKYDGVNKRSMPRNLIYNVYEHATGLKLVREHLFAAFLA